ncbi:hypothetical protein YC2023_060679 [Brassica napus]
MFKVLWMKIRQPPPPTTTIVSIRLPPSPPQPPPPPLWYPPFFHHALHRHRHRFHGTEPREESENQGDKGLGRFDLDCKAPELLGRETEGETMIWLNREVNSERRIRKSKRQGLGGGYELVPISDYLFGSRWVRWRKRLGFIRFEED